MESNEILEGNKLIASFMGKDDEHRFLFDHLNTKALYHLSWDWLMPVFEKIEQISELSPSINFGCGTKIWTDGKLETIIKILPETKKETNICISWKAVVQFIKLHNEQNKK